MGGWPDRSKPTGTGNVGGTLQSGTLQCLHWSMIVCNIEISRHDQRVVDVVDCRFA